ncbi:C40 family peptidase [Clostridium psychrophilum]|uniref:C40 family peptidase n=1 Tax=Clostridium psychrophilum TaxID=132926 RepID=UPI001C0E7088|nr:SH3 domain-containing C40 family peptidase [Clostridium psychrophilum]MBU3183166.1 C40 family peptidase [Clostridium psychrophilum]
MKKTLALVAILLTLAGSHTVFAASGVVNASTLNIRQKPTLKSSVLVSMPRNTKINTLGKSGAYYKVTYKGKTRYAYGFYIKMVQAATVSSSSASKVNTVVSKAHKLLGTRYRYGGTSPSTGFDCSGLTQYVYKSVGVALPRTTYQQVRKGKSVGVNSLKAGDLVFFIGDQHVGLYIGNNKFIQARKTGTVVQTTQLSGYWRSSFVTARRIL